MKINGTDIIVLLGGDPIACQREAVLTFNTEMFDTTCKGDAPNRTILPGMASFEFTLDGLADFQPDSPQIGLASLIGNKVPVEIIFRISPTDNLSTFMAYISGVEVNAPVEDVTTYSATFSGTGEPTQYNRLVNGKLRETEGTNNFPGWTKTVSDGSITEALLGGSRWALMECGSVDNTVHLSQEIEADVSYKLVLKVRGVIDADENLALRVFLTDNTEVLEQSVTNDDTTLELETVFDSDTNTSIFFSPNGTEENSLQITDIYLIKQTN